MDATPAGWYPDPAGIPLQRFWDGRQWTGWTRPWPDTHQQELLRAARRSAANTTAIRATITALIVVAFLVYLVVRVNQNING